LQNTPAAQSTAITYTFYNATTGSSVAFTVRANASTGSQLSSTISVTAGDLLYVSAYFTGDISQPISNVIATATLV
jgi:uncharacterized RmlC-like cupin family protein